MLREDVVVYPSPHKVQDEGVCDLAMGGCVDNPIRGAPGLGYTFASKTGVAIRAGCAERAVAACPSSV